MEKATPPRTYDPPLGASPEEQPDTAPTSPLVLIVNSYPDDLVVKYLVAPFANHLLKTILALLLFLFGSLIVCSHWNSEEVCERRFHWMAFFIAVGINSVMGYSYYLRRKLERQRQSHRKA